MIRQPRRTLLKVAIGSAAIFGAFAFMENRDLKRWSGSSSEGEFVMAMRMDHGTVTAFEEAAGLVLPLLPEAQLGDGSVQIYQKWWGSGWRRYHRQVPTEFQPQEMVDMAWDTLRDAGIPSSEFGDFQICIVDSKGQVHSPFTP